LELGLFTYAPMIAAAALLPSWFWDTLLVNFSATLAPNVYNRYWNMGGSLTLYYASGPYSYATKFLLQLANISLGLSSPILAAETQSTQNFEVASAEDNSANDIGKVISENNIYWLAVDGTGRRHMRHRGALALMNEVPFLVPVVPILQKIEKVIAYIYRFYAAIFSLPIVQYTLACKATPTPVPPRASSRPARLRKVRVLDLVAAVFLIYVLWWNVGTVSSEYQVPQSMQWLGMLVRIDQWWSMFAPFPMKDDGWFIISAKLANGKEIDLFKPGHTLSYDKPKFVSKTFPDHRWRRYLMNMWASQHQEKRLFYGRYLCRQWNWYGRGGKDREYALKTFKIVYMREITLPNYRVKGPEPQVLWEHQC